MSYQKSMFDFFNNKKNKLDNDDNLQNQVEDLKINTESNLKSTSKRNPKDVYVDDVHLPTNIPTDITITKKKIITANKNNTITPGNDNKVVNYNTKSKVIKDSDESYGQEEESGVEEESVKNTKKTKQTKNKNKDDSLTLSDTKEVNQAYRTNQDAFANPENGLPNFLKIENIKDKNKLLPNDPNYDPSTLYIPEEFIVKQTPSMAQYWSFKKDNFDKVILFKLGKFYEMFFDDAIIGNQVLGLKWMGNKPEKLHVGFPEVNLIDKCKRLVNAGFKVAVVEQTEKAADIKLRQNTEETTNKKDKLAKRELTQVITKGSLSNTENEYNNNYCVFLSHEISDSFEGYGIIIVDLSTSKMLIHKINNKSNTKQLNSQELYRNLCSLLYKIAPSEIIFLRDNLKQELINFSNRLSSKPQVSSIKNSFTRINAENIIKKWFNKSDNNSELLNDIITKKELNYVLASVYTCIVYLEKNLLAESFFDICDVKYFDDVNYINKKMILDFLTISKLELVETKLDINNSSAGSLNEVINRASTQFGKRNITNWLLNPLYNIEEIHNRLNTIELISYNNILMESLQAKLSKLPDMERKISQMYKYSVNTSSKAVYFDNVSQKKLFEFKDLLEKIKESCNYLIEAEEFIKCEEEYLMENNENLNNIENNLFRNVIINDKNNTEIIEQVNYLLSLIIIANNDGEPEIRPKLGSFDVFDAKVKTLDNIKFEAEEELNKIRSEFGNNKNIIFTKNKFSVFEFEVPEHLVKGQLKPKYFEMTGTRKGFIKFITKAFKDFEFKYDVALDEVQREIARFNIFLFSEFLKRKYVWDLYLNRIITLDSIIGLSVTSLYSGLGMTRPHLLNNGKVIEFLELSHPCLKNRVNKFVPNDVHTEDTNNMIIITGPNMGGKSTLLKQICIAIILGQIGCYIPAKKGTFSLVDRIFTRIGAKDELLQGKSTFFVEMEETKIILEQSTQNSLIIMDELGRGTSTDDGMKIAKATILCLLLKNNPRVFFTTHYHQIIEWCKQQKGAKLYFMQCIVDSNDKKIQFLYKFTEGICPESYGLLVAKIAGIDSKILERAEYYKSLLNN